MFKNSLAFVGLLALVGGVGVWQFGYFNQVRLQIERETAVARAQAIVRDMESRASTLSKRARDLRIEAQSREKAVLREEEQTRKTREAIVALAQAARAAGLAKPSEAGPEDLKRAFQFAGRMLTAAEVYRLLERWQETVTAADQRLAVTRTMIDRIRSTADQLEAKQSLFLTQMQATRATLERLELQRDLSKLDAELAELGASASGNPAGELQGVLETLQKQIDDYEAASEVLGGQKNQADTLTADEVLAGTAGGPSTRQKLDALWGDSK